MLTETRASSVPEPELGKWAMLPSSAASMDIMTEVKRPKRTLKETATREKERVTDHQRRVDLGLTFSRVPFGGASGLCGQLELRSSEEKKFIREKE
ncbi:hypothetical protein GBF38_007798 [Nibea albiflora]|uniref:Uncharacterized protein n=1 Tax=Nibea albiflora TaxID=240163 RepID=A0ACB7ESJ9_NIBAL|nr:hypothetical protein GBF38_007798 [Nibea albiflora]